MDKNVLTLFVRSYVANKNISMLTMDTCGKIAEEIVALMNGAIQKDDIIDILTEEYNIYLQPASSSLDDGEQSNWLTQFKADGQSDWKFWRDYKKTLTLPAPAVVEIDQTTDKVLNMMANPKATGDFYRAGLVVGNVQSGKTGNFIGLINKSLDAGFKIVLVLAGMYDDLRAQTQMRIDKGVIGKISDPDSTKRGCSIGVGKQKNHPNVLSLTSSNLHGDFKPTAQNVNGILTSTDPTILVCKKNGSILKNVLEFFAAAGVVAQDGYKLIKDIPIIIIDDEADNASIDVGRDEISTINGAIRAILALFSKAAYVGYTATPYANIFISTAADSNVGCFEISNKDRNGNRANIRQYRLGQYDIFPRSFIVNLTAPSNYIGPNVIFGIPSKYGDHAEPLPIISNITDGYDKIKRHKYPGYIPESMKDAILHYFVATAYRRARGQKQDHSSMLINVCQFTDWQDKIWSCVNTYVSELCDRISMLDTYPATEKALKEKFDIINSTSKEIVKLYPEWKNLLKIHVWDEVKSELAIVASKVKNEVRVLHSGLAEDPNANTTRLDYFNYEDNSNPIDNGLYTIAVGGNTLSRGLTLEGLCVSYFLRSSKTFDTLMQMGRWFGYRDGYVDCTRLYLHKDIEYNLSTIAKATQEMRDQFDDMCERHIKPSEYGLKVMCVPGRLEATAKNKFGDTDTGQLSYSMSTVQAYQILKDPAKIAQNKNAVETLISQLGNYCTLDRKGAPMKHLFWKASSSSIIDFIRNFETPDVQLNPDLLIAFINKQVQLGNLTDWTVAIINVGDSSTHNMQQIAIDGQTVEIGRSRRQYSVDADDTMYVVKNASITGAEHESLDLTDTEYDEALQDSIKNYHEAKKAGKTKANTEPKIPGRTESKLKRDPSKGLLMIFPLDLEGAGDDIFSYAISFPKLDAGAVGFIYRGQRNAFEVKN